jgi:hypothetical protein
MDRCCSARMRAGLMFVIAVWLSFFGSFDTAMRPPLK